MNRLCARRVGRMAERDEAVDAHVEVKAQLLVDVVANLSRGSPGQPKEALSRAVTPAPAL